MSGKPSMRYPEANAEERALQAKQLALIEKGEAREALWDPILMQEMGYRESTDPESGEMSIGRIPEEELYQLMTPEQRLSTDIGRLASERELSALKGELPVDPALEREIGETEQELQERMFRQLGGGWETSTPGIYARAQHEQRASELRDAMRRGEMTTSEALYQSRSGSLAEAQQRLSQQTAQRTAAPIALSGAYEGPKSWYERGREGKFKGKLAELEARKAKMSGISSGVGSGMSMAGGMCCWNFLAAHGYVPEEVKQYRDEHYPKGCPVSKGYKWMSQWAVPLMESYPKFAKFMDFAMARPMTKYAQWYYGKSKYGWIFKPIVFFWTGLWGEWGKKVKEARRFYRMSEILQEIN